MEQIGTTKQQSYLLSRLIGLDFHTADMHHIPFSDETLIGAPSGDGEMPAWSFGALCELIPARIRVPSLNCIEYDGKRKFHIFYTYGVLNIGKHDDSKRYNNYFATYEPIRREYNDRPLMPNSLSTDKQEDVDRYKGTWHANGFFGVIYNLVQRLVEDGYIETEWNKNYKMFISYVSFKGEKKPMVFNHFTDKSKEEEEAEWEKRIDDDVEWYHVEQCTDFNYGRPKSYLLP